MLWASTSVGRNAAWVVLLLSLVVPDTCNTRDRDTNLVNHVSRRSVRTRSDSRGSLPMLPGQWSPHLSSPQLHVWLHVSGEWYEHNMWYLTQRTKGWLVSGLFHVHVYGSHNSAESLIGNIYFNEPNLPEFDSLWRRRSLPLQGPNKVQLNSNRVQ